MCDLGQCRLEPLPMRMEADPQFEPAVRRQSRARLFAAGHHGNAPPGINGRAVRRLLAIDRQAQPDATPVRLAFPLSGADRIGVNRLQGPPQRLRIIAAVEVLVGDVVERHLFGPDQIPNRTVSGLRPAAEATVSSASSRAKQTPVLATPR